MRSEGQFGANYKINGHRISGVTRYGQEYRILFERCFEENTLEEIEKIDGEHVSVEQLRENYPTIGLPEGYAFVVKDLTYIKAYDSFAITLEAAKRYWGDVTPYQAQIDALTETIAQKDSALTEKEEALTAANALLAEIEEAYDEQ